MSIYRARSATSAEGPISNGAGSGQYSANEAVGSSQNTQRQLDVGLEQDQQATDAMTDSQEAFAEADDEGGWEQLDDQSDGQEHQGKHADGVSTGKSFKSGYAKSKADYGKSKGSKGLQKISIGEYENIYITDKGEHWYVAENPDGTVTKTQMQEINGELQPVGETNVYPSDGGKGKSEGSQGK